MEPDQRECAVGAGVDLALPSDHALSRGLLDLGPALLGHLVGKRASGLLHQLLAPALDKRPFECRQYVLRNHGNVVVQSVRLDLRRALSAGALECPDYRVADRRCGRAVGATPWGLTPPVAPQNGRRVVGGSSSGCGVPMLGRRDRLR